MTKYNSNFLGALPFSDTTAQLDLAASTALTYTVPGASNKQYRIEFSFNPTTNVWVGYNVTATVPTAGTLTSNHNIERNPGIRYARGGDVLSFISDAHITGAGFSLLEVP